MTQTTMTRTGAHRPRPISFLKLHESNGWRLKFYGIAATGERPRPELVKTAELLVPTALPHPAAHKGGEDPYDIDRYGAGFVIVHDAADYAFALYDWWAGENEIHQRIFSSLPNRLGAMRPHPTPAIGCVWELAVTDFERRAWLRHVLAREGGADMEAYLAEHFEGEV
ncbi:hypothetical protein [Actinoallomurus sp. NPDC052274]|uniref:hypothetical protein n=1 Tax=Actinoallomurus sp. NPDC052274 TaxID=3155420 RepID=UPI003443430E